MPLDTDQVIDDQFGEWVRLRRHSKVLNYREAANISGISAGRWMSIERGAVRKAVTREECKRIAETLEMPVDSVIAKAVGAQQ